MIEIKIKAPTLGDSNMGIEVNGCTGQSGIVALKAWLAKKGSRKLKLSVQTRAEALDIELASKPKLEFYCQEYIGCEALGTVTRRPIMFKNALWEGAGILCPTPWGLARAVVRSINDDCAYAESDGGDHGFNLQFSRDARKSWVCSAVGNLRGLEKVKFA